MGKDRSYGVIHLKKLDYIEDEMEIVVKIEIVDPPSGNPYEKDFLPLSAKAIHLFANRFDRALKMFGPSEFYEDYMTWRKIAVAVQETRQGMLEIDQLEKNISELTQEEVEILELVEKEYGLEARQLLENSAVEDLDSM